MTSPSFFYSLFKRGRYCRLPRRADDQTDSSGRQEIERFTAAAIAFCVTHDADFRQHFWENVCRTEADPLIPESLTIEVEPFPWADLLVRSPGPANSTVHVIECKVAAGLAAHQNPNEHVFESIGYGSQFALAEGKKASLRYVVLGLRQPLNLPAKHEKLRIRLAQKQWRDLEYPPEQTPSALVRDLFSSLGAMGVGNFHMIKTQNLRINAGLEGVAQAFSILEDLVRHLDLEDAAHNFRAWKHDDGGSELGVFIRSSGGLGLEGRLRKATQSTDYLLWIGYIAKPEPPPERSVWVYCETTARAEWLQAQLASSFPTTMIQGDDHYSCVVVSERPPSELSDLRWFEKVIRAAAAVPAR